MTADGYFQRALRHHHQSDLVAAKADYLCCLDLKYDHVHALINLASICRRLGDRQEALSYLGKAIALAPRDQGAHYNFGNLLREMGDLRAAEAAYRNALAIDAGQAPAWYNLALTLVDLKQPEAAQTAYRQALAADPSHQEARLNLAVLLAEEGQVSAAEAEYRVLLGNQPDYTPALNNLATVQQDTGHRLDAVTTLQRAVELQPDLPQPRSNLLMGLQYHPNASVADLIGYARQWGHWATLRAERLLGQAPGRPSVAAATNGPLRVGYVSADFCMHPVGLFLKDVIARHDPGVVQPVCYSNGSPRDEVTEALYQAVAGKTGSWAWREVKDSDDVALARQIQADGIHILVDLSGHTGKSRVAMFALRPAPVQISWLGYFATTGLPAMDFVILDPCHAPPGTEAQFTERIIHLPHNRFCYSPVSFAPEVSSPPFLNNDYVTFGSFNNTAKFNEPVIDAWAAILRAVSGSRLILKWRTFIDSAYRARVLRLFAERGITAERIELRPMSGHRQLLEEYADLDIALDPFPFSGGHTSCEALWMGVPVVTLPCERVVSRQTWSFLNNIGLPGLAAQDEDSYIRLAVSLANSPERLLQLRQELRVRMRGSALCDVDGFTRYLEAGYRLAWQTVTGNAVADAVTPSSPSPAEQAERLHQAGLQAWQTGDAEVARQHLEAAIALNPDVAVYHANLGVMLKALGVGFQRIDCYRRAVALAPTEGLYHANLAAALNDDEQFAAGESSARQAVALDPKRAENWFNLGSSLQGLKRYREAAETFAQAASLRADFVEAWRAAGGAWNAAREPIKAAQSFQGALRAVGPSPSVERANLLGALGEMLEAIYQFSEAEACYGEALAISPDDPVLLTNLGNALRSQQQLDAARVCYERVIELKPDSAGAYSNLGAVAQTAGDIAQAVACHLRSISLDPGIVPVWSNLAASINNRLLVFARKPAPVQVTWMGYVTTTGMSAMDWRVTHVDADPAGAEAHYSERLWRLDGTMWCYRPLPDMPEVVPPPFLSKGVVTFGSFNRYSKNSPQVLAAWAEILSRVPHSRLV